MKHLLKYLLYKLRIIKLVYTIDGDKEQKLRVVWYGNNGKRYVYGYDSKSMFELCASGVLNPVPGYLNQFATHWKPYPDPRSKDLRKSPFAFFGRNKAIEMAARLEGAKE